MFVVVVFADLIQTVVNIIVFVFVYNRSVRSMLCCGIRLVFFFLHTSVIVSITFTKTILLQLKEICFFFSYHKNTYS